MRHKSIEKWQIPVIPVFVLLFILLVLCSGPMNAILKYACINQGDVQDKYTAFTCTLIRRHHFYVSIVLVSLLVLLPLTENIYAIKEKLRETDELIVQ